MRLLRRRHGRGWGVGEKLADWRFCDLGSWNCANIYNFKFQVLFTLLLLSPSLSHSPSLSAGEGVGGGREYNFCLKSKSLSCIIQAMREGASNSGRKVGDASAMIDRTSMLWQPPCSSLCTHAVVCVCVCGSLGGWLSRSKVWLNF